MGPNGERTDEIPIPPKLKVFEGRSEEEEGLDVSDIELLRKDIRDMRDDLGAKVEAVGNRLTALESVGPILGQQRDKRLDEHEQRIDKLEEATGAWKITWAKVVGAFLLLTLLSGGVSNVLSSIIGTKPAQEVSE